MLTLLPRPGQLVLHFPQLTSEPPTSLAILISSVTAQDLSIEPLAARSDQPRLRLCLEVAASPSCSEAATAQQLQRAMSGGPSLCVLQLGLAAAGPLVDSLRLADGPAHQPNREAPPVWLQWLPRRVYVQRHTRRVALWLYSLFFVVQVRCTCDAYAVRVHAHVQHTPRMCMYVHLHLHIALTMALLARRRVTAALGRVEPPTHSCYLLLTATYCHLPPLTTDHYLLPACSYSGPCGVSCTTSPPSTRSSTLSWRAATCCCSPATLSIPLCNPKYPTLQPYVPTLQPYVPMLQPYLQARLDLLLTFVAPRLWANVVAIAAPLVQA